MNFTQVVKKPQEPDHGNTVFCNDHANISLFPSNKCISSHTMSSPLHIEQRSPNRFSKSNFFTTAALLQCDRMQKPTSILAEATVNSASHGSVSVDQNLRSNLSKAPNNYLATYLQRYNSESRGREEHSTAVDIYRTNLLSLFISKLKHSQEYCVQLYRPKLHRVQSDEEPREDHTSSILLDPASPSYGTSVGYGCILSNEQAVLSLCVNSKEESLSF